MDVRDDVVAAEWTVPQFRHYDDVQKVLDYALVHFPDNELRLRFLQGCGHGQSPVLSHGCLFVFIRI